QYMADSDDETFDYAQKIILHSPQHLLINLNRNNETSNETKSEKNSETKVVIDTELTLDSNRFELGGFICCEAGEGQSSHYYSYVKIEQQWYLCDDLNVKEIVVNELLVVEQSQVVLVLYNAIA
ncbi:MAG: ubiquitin carboxyl-terminal hydrolase, partial [Algicola sp.]|nr:ubiquitin carboxyl-terminal hydrolase [Algicola sp.]